MNETEQTAEPDIYDAFVSGWIMAIQFGRPSFVKPPISASMGYDKWVLERKAEAKK